MEFLQLKYFCHAAQTESFTNTAKHFSVPPSDISQSVKRLEKELGVQLFDRSANRIRLNDAGRLFGAEASASLCALERAVLAVREQNKRLRICVLVNRRIVMQTAEKFRKQHPDIDIVLTHQEQDEPELLITATPPERGFQEQKLLSEPLLLALPKGDPLTEKENISAADFAEKPFITMGKGNNLFDITEQVCRDMGFAPRIAIQGDDPFYIRQCVELGLGVAIVPAISWRGQFPDGVVLKKLAVSPRNTYICTRAHPSEGAKAFAALLREECEKEAMLPFV